MHWEDPEGLGRVSFFFKAEEYSTVCAYHIFFIHSSADGHFVCFHTLTIVDHAAMNNGSPISLLLKITS